jgi:uncharacterized membrane protein YfcA
LTLIITIGLLGGFVSGFFGVGCGIIITPALMELGLPPLVAVSNQLCHSVGVSATNFLTYKRKRDVDFHLAAYILLGGFLGAVCDWFMFQYQGDSLGTSNTFIRTYIVVLFVVGSIMLIQGAREWKRRGRVKKYIPGVMMRRWMVYVPFHTIFVRSRTEMSVVVPMFTGFLAGILAPSLGGGNSLFMIPIVTYLIGRISPVVNGTTSFTGCVITGVVTLTHACGRCYCDLPFVLVLFAGATSGTWIGVRLSYNVRRYYINILASLVVFLMASRQVFRLLDGSFANGIIDLAGPSKSVMLDIVSKNPIIYTIACVAIIVVAAFISEKAMQLIADKRKIFMK